MIEKDSCQSIIQIPIEMQGEIVGDNMSNRWVIDANDISLDEVKPFATSLLHPTSVIERFLESHKQAQLLVVAPKGFGKTLLLKAKRVALEKSIPKCLPENSLVERPGTLRGVLTSSEYKDIRDDSAYWKSVWLIALTISVLKAVDTVMGDVSDPTAKVMQDKDLTAACDIFDRVLKMSRSDYFKVRDDYNARLLPGFRRIHSQIALFIDNIDEAFVDWLKDEHERGISGQIPRSFEYLAQSGIAHAARELHSINNHVKIFVSIRREVLQRVKEEGPLGLQLRGSCIEISYSRADLVEIIRRNIREEPKSNLRSPNAESEIAQFLGQDNIRIVHPITGDEEPIEEFWLRHTFGRPRDIAFIGGRISEISPRDRTSHEIRNVIRQCAVEIGRTYLAEMIPHFDSFDWVRLARMIPSNHISRKQLEEICLRYQSETGFLQGEASHPFCILYIIGMLGCVEFDPVSRTLIQRFRSPGELPLDKMGSLPVATDYLMHPVMDELIATEDTTYFNRVDSANIVGPNRLWRATREQSFVLKGDVKGYSVLMGDPVAANSFPVDFNNLVRICCGRLTYHKVADGDSVTLIDDNPYEIIAAAQALCRALETSAYTTTMRFGGDAGFVVIENRQGDNPTITGKAVRVAARIEPHVTPGKIVITDTFVDAANRRFGDARLDVREVTIGEMTSLSHSDGRFELAKNAGDESTLRKLFYLNGTKTVRL